MVTFPVADGARLLGIHPKTLHRWLTQSNFPVATHPRDARLKCLTLEQLQHLAQIHGRPVPSPATTPPSATREQDSHLPEHEGEPLPIACEVPPPLPHEADLIHKLSCLETRVATLSEQLAHLALLLLHERERTVESRLSQLETTLQALAGKPAPSPALADQEVTVSDNQPPPVPKPARPLHPMEPLVRSRMPPSIEYGAQGTYVIVSSQDGEVHVEPDSPPWFEWLATLSSFRFLSPQGRFTAYRDTSLGQQTCSWVAYRRIHGRSYRHGLGVTDRLTITHLEQMAAKLQSYLE